VLFKNNLLYVVPSDFQAKYKEHLFLLFKTRLNIAYLFSIILVPTAVIFDTLIFREQWKSILVIRIFSTVTCLVLYYLSNFTRIKNYPSVMCHILNMVVVVTIVHLCYMTGKYASPYYAGLILIFICIAMIMPWNIKDALLYGIVIFVIFIGYNLVPSLLMGEMIQWNLFWNSIYFLLFSFVMVVFSTGVMESYRRELFTRNEQDALIKKQLLLKKNELEEVNNQLICAENEKKEFVANITHDLKTPLSIISGHTETLRASFEENCAESKYFNYIGHSITQINHLLDMLIAMALLDKKDEKPNCELYNYPLFVKSFCSHFIVQGERRGINFLIESLEENVVVSLDTIWIERIIGNLIQNSFKFTAKGGTIRVRLFCDNEYIYTEVIDTGAGISSEKLPNIFKRKYQAHDDKKHLGYGLGLTITKEMVERLGGTIDAFSEEGKGTTLRFSLPIHCDQFAPVKNASVTETERRSGIDRRLENRIKIVQDKIEQDGQIEKIQINIEQFENKSPSLPTILICEDNHGQLHLLIEGLKKNFNLVIAENGMQGLQKLDNYRSKVDCIISDVRMPEMDGFEFCQNVFEQEHYRLIPFIFLTSYTNDREQLKGLAYGATDFLQKPFNQLILIEKLNHWLSRREHEQILENLVTTLENKNEEICKLRSIIGHEIRNPLMILNSVHYYFSKLKSLYYDDNNENTKKYWESLDRIHNVICAINSVLDSAKIIESGISSTSLKREPVATLLDNAYLETVHMRSSVKMQVNNPFTDEFVVCDKQLLTQVFVNLIRNACEAISEAKCEDGVIKINVYKKNNCFNIGIADNGAGISEKTLNNLFQYNFTTKKDGTGIGLYFSKRILNVHNGDILVESKVGEGTTFTVVIP